MDRRAFLSVAAVSLAAGCHEDDESPPTPALSESNAAYGTAFSTEAAWPIHGFDAGRRGWHPATRVPNGDVDAAWIRTPIEGQRTRMTTPPVTDDRRVYVGSGVGDDEGTEPPAAFVAAFDGETGERRWRTAVTAVRVRGVTVADGRVLAVSTTHEPPQTTLTALAATDGSTQWQVELPAYPNGAPIVVDDSIYLASDAGGLTAVSLDGTHQWDRSVGSGEEAASTVPAANASSVFVGTDRGRLVAFDPERGDRQWRRQIVTNGHRPRIQTMPTVDGGTIFVTGTDYRLYAIDATDGTVRWTKWNPLVVDGMNEVLPAVVVGEETLYVGTEHAGLVALRRRDGSERWHTDEYGKPVALTDELLVALGGGGVQAYDLAGHRQWTVPLRAFETNSMGGYIMDSHVALAHNRVYVALSDGRVYSLGAR